MRPGADIPVEWVVKYKPKSVAEGRLRIIDTLLGLAFAAIIIRLLLLSLDFSNGRGARAPAAAAWKARPDITDRNGEVLARNLPMFDLYANSKNMVSPEESSARLVKILPELKYEDALSKTKSGRTFSYLARKITPATKDKIVMLGEPGFEFAATESRVYPQDNLFAHIIGGVDVDNNGISGIEKYMDEAGLVHGRGPVRLSVDMYIQDALRQNLNRAMAEMGAKSAAGIIMDVKSAEVLGLVSLPDFPGGGNREAEAAIYNNHATLDVYEIGSVMKIFNTALALEHRYPEDRIFDISRPLKIGGFHVRDSHPKKFRINMREAFIVSSNIASATIARELGIERQRSFFEKLGFLSRMEFELPGKGAPLLPKKWDENANMTIGYGYGISLSLLHVISAANAIINDGMYASPTILKRDGEAPPESRQIARLATAEEMKKLMRLVITDGTGHMANLSDIKTGGKTGTSYKLTNGKYDSSRIRAFFFSVFPIESPKYTMFVMLDEASNGGCTSAACTAVPISAKVIEEIGPMLNLDFRRP